MKIKSQLSEDLKTAIQWARKGRIINSDAKGQTMWSNTFHSGAFTYYELSETHEGAQMELDAFWKPIKAERAAQQRLYRLRKRQEEDQQQQEIQAAEARQCQMNASATLCQSAAELPIIPCQNPSGILVLDTETTGLATDDEVIQISAVDGCGNVLLNTYVHPCWHSGWPEAEYINQITPDMVQNAPYPHELVPVLRGIFASARTIVAYNYTFDRRMILQSFSLDAGECAQEIVDVMSDFAAVWGEWSEYFGSYAWKSLGTCANYFGYEFQAHDSLEDTKATLYCFHMMRKIGGPVLDPAAIEKIRQWKSRQLPAGEGKQENTR